MTERIKEWAWVWVPATCVGLGFLVGFLTDIGWLGVLVAFIGIAFGVAYAPHPEF
jgi:hypothetical protein